MHAYGFRKGKPPRRQGLVSAPQVQANPVQTRVRSVAIRAAPNGGEHALMADLAYAVLLIAAFGVLALALRGLEKL